MNNHFISAEPFLKVDDAIDRLRKLLPKGTSVCANTSRTLNTVSVYWNAPPVKVKKFNGQPRNVNKHFRHSAVVPVGPSGFAPAVLQIEAAWNEFQMDWMRTFSEGNPITPEQITEIEDHKRLAVAA